MSSLMETRLECNNSIKINFDGGDLSSDTGLLLIKEFADKIGFYEVIENIFKTNDAASFRIHTDAENLQQEIYQTIAGYFQDDDADELTNDPVFNTVGTVYTSNGAVEFMKPLLTEYIEQYPDINVYLRGDSGFVVPELFSLLEHNGCSYAIRLKANNILYQEAAHLTDELNDLTATNKVDYAVCYGEFYYQAAGNIHAGLLLKQKNQRVKCFTCIRLS